MITLLLHLLRLLPFLCGGHRQLAIENLALRQQIAVYKTDGASAETAHDGSPLVGRAGQGLGHVVWARIGDCNTSDVGGASLVPDEATSC